MKTARARVLVTDDEPAVLDMLRDLLIANGYEVMAVTTGAAALAAEVPTRRSPGPGPA